MPVRKQKYLLDVEPDQLNERQKNFCRHYVSGVYSAAGAATASGYSEQTANRIASNLLTKVYIQDYIAICRKDLGERTGITRDKIANLLAAIAFTSTKDFYDNEGRLIPVHLLSDAAAQALGGIEAIDLGMGTYLKKIKKLDPTKAAELLNRMLGYNEPDKTEINANVSSVKEVFEIGGKKFEL